MTDAWLHDHLSPDADLSASNVQSKMQDHTFHTIGLCTSFHRIFSTRRCMPLNPGFGWVGGNSFVSLRVESLGHLHATVVQKMQHPRNDVSSVLSVCSHLWIPHRTQYWKKLGCSPDLVFTTFFVVTTSVGMEPSRSLNECTEACVIPTVVLAFFWLENAEITVLLDWWVADFTPTDPTEREDVERDDMPGNTRGNFAMAPCAFFLRGTLGRVAKVFFSDWDLGFGLAMP